MTGAASIRPGSVLRAGLAGAVAGAVGLAASELVAGVVPGTPSLVVAVGTLVIALQPPGAQPLMATLFGTNDKTALNVAVVLVGLLIATLAGVLGRRSFAVARWILVTFGVVAFVATILQPLDSAPLAAVNAAVATAAAIWTLRVLMADARLPAPLAGGAPDWGRRWFLLRAAGLLAGAIVAGALGRSLLDRRHPSGAPTSSSLPAAVAVVPALTAEESLSAPGITPIVTPPQQFYRIDTALLVPQVDASTWQLRVSGMVDHPLTLTYAELLARPLFEQYVTLSCVSNDVGGVLIGNTLWTGVHLKAVFAEAGIHPGATQIVGRSVDGFTVGFPTSWALDSARDPMIAVGMNRVPLPAEHGYPARLVVPGLYGYVSATKWLTEIELTTREAFDAYWVHLGWAKDGPILTQARIDHPSGGIGLAAGLQVIDGVAWAPDRGVSRVEVRVDDGPWEAAELARAISKATWVQWILRWQATPGGHTIAVRATDGTGQLQTATPGGPAPDGARGYHTIGVIVH